MPKLANMNSADPLARIPQKGRRMNLKSKRKRNLIKKAIELSSILDMEMCLIFKDLDTGKITQYTSGDKTREHFTIEKALEEIQEFKTKRRTIKTYDNDDYMKLAHMTNNPGEKDEEDEDCDPSLLVKRTAKDFLEQNFERGAQG